MQPVLINQLQVKAYKHQKVHGLTSSQTSQRAKLLVRRAERDDYAKIMFSDEKNSPVEQFVNKENDWVYLKERLSEDLSHRLVT
jgi:cob(I)alamin adenosyltransferase